MTITVIVPTFQRPTYLRGCLDSIWSQRRLPEQVFVVVRDGDDESLFAIRSFIARHTSSIQLDVVMIQNAGFLPPIQAGIDAAQSGIIAFIDDDAIAHPDWLERLEKHYQDPAVGGVGGRSVDYFGGVEEKYGSAKIQGKVFWYGRCEGNLYRDSISDQAVKVDGLMGCNMSYRKEVLDKIRLDWTLKNGRAYQYELDLGLQIKKLGFKLIYDPTARVDHHRLVRPGGARQLLTDELAYWMSFNTEYVIFKHSNFFQHCAAMIYQIFIGQSLRWGMLSLAWYWIRFRMMPKVFKASLAGRIAGIKTALFQKPVYLKSNPVFFPQGVNPDSTEFLSPREPALPRLAVSPK